MLEFQNTKTVLLKDILQIGQFTVRWTYVINNLNDEEISGSFYEKEL